MQIVLNNDSKGIIKCEIQFEGNDCYILDGETIKGIWTNSQGNFPLKEGQEFQINGRVFTLKNINYEGNGYSLTDEEHNEINVKSEIYNFPIYDTDSNCYAIINFKKDSIHFVSFIKDERYYFLLC